MLGSIHLRNFGAVGPSALDVEVGRVTVLVGANGSGKSSVLRALGVLGQTAERRDRRGLVHDGPRARYENPAHMYFGLRPSAPLELGVTVTIDGALARALASENERVPVPPTVPLVYCCTSSIDRAASRITQSIQVGDHVAVASLEPLPQLHIDRILTTGLASPDGVLDPNAFRPRDSKEELFAVAVTTVGRFLARRVRSAATLRAAERYSVENTTRPSEDTGPNGAFTLQYITESKLRAPDRGHRLDDWLDRLGLRGFRVGPEAGRFAPRFDDSASGATLPLYLAAQGHQQILEVIALLAFAEPGSVVTVEEPENGLHPAAQVVTAEIIAEAVRQHDLQVILSTQSPTFALACCRAVKRDLLRPEELSLYELRRGPHSEWGASGDVQAQALRVDAGGLTYPAWFSGFADAEAELIREFLPPENSDAPPRKAKAAGTGRRRR